MQCARHTARWLQFETNTPTRLLHISTLPAQTSFTLHENRGIFVNHRSRPDPTLTKHTLDLARLPGVTPHFQSLFTDALHANTLTSLINAPPCAMLPDSAAAQATAMLDTYKLPPQTPISDPLTSKCAPHSDGDLDFASLQTGTRAHTSPHIPNNARHSSTHSVTTPSSAASADGHRR